MSMRNVDRLGLNLIFKLYNAETRRILSESLFSAFLCELCACLHQAGLCLPAKKKSKRQAGVWALIIQFETLLWHQERGELEFYRDVLFGVVGTTDQRT